MSAFLQLATGTSVREELTDCVVANNDSAIEKGVAYTFKEQMDFLGDYKSCKVGQPNRYGCCSLEVTYIDTFGDEETSNWELRPIKLFL
jgi:hypothetical protein